MLDRTPDDLGNTANRAAGTTPPVPDTTPAATSTDAAPDVTDTPVTDTADRVTTPAATVDEAAAAEKAAESYGSRERFNAREALNPLKAQVIQAHARGDDAKLEIIEQLIIAINAKLHEQEILLSIDAGIAALKALIIAKITNNNFNFQERLDAWVVDYRRLEGNNQHVVLANRQANNIIQCLLARNPLANSVWGDEIDCRTALQSVTTDPDDPNSVYEENHDYILPPVPIVASAIEALAANPVDIIVNKILAIIAKSPDKNYIQLHIPVNAGQSHWRLFNVTISQGRIILADLTDSMYSTSPAALRNHPAFTNAQAVVNRINAGQAPCRVTAKVTGLQRDGHRCMDYVAQGALRLSPSIDIENDEALKTLRDSKTPHGLRTAVISKIIEHHAGIRAAGITSAAGFSAGITARPTATGGLGNYGRSTSFEGLGGFGGLGGGFGAFGMNNPFGNATGTSHFTAANSEPFTGVDNFYITNQARITDGYKLAEAFRQNSSIPADQREAIVLKFLSVISSNSQLIAVLPYLPEDRRLDFINTNVKLDMRRSDSLNNMIALLLPEQVPAFINQNFDSYVNDFDKLAECLLHVEPENRFDLALTKNRFLKSARDISSILALLPLQRRAEFFCAIKNNVTNSLILKNVLDLSFEPNERMAVIRDFQHVINYSVDINNIKDHLPEEDKLSFFCQYQDIVITNPRLKQEMYHLGWSNLLFTLQHKNEIGNWNSLARILENFPEEERITIVEDCIDSMNAGHQHISKVLALIPAELRYGIAVRVGNKISPHDFIHILELIPEDMRMDFLNAHPDKIRNYSHVLNFVPPEHQFAFVNARQDAIQESAALLNVLTRPTLPTEPGYLQNKLAYPARIEFLVSIKIVGEIDRYLGHILMLHEDRVRELRRAILAATTIQEIYQLIHQQADLMQGTATQRAYPDLSQTHFLNHAPGKKGISIGYRALINNCIGLLNLHEIRDERAPEQIDNRLAPGLE